MSSAALYLILKLDTFQTLFILGALMSFFTLLIIVLTAFVEHTYKEDAVRYLEDRKTIITTIMTVGIISTIIAIFMPTTKDMLIIKGYESIKNTGVTLENVVEKVNNATDAWVKSLNR